MTKEIDENEISIGHLILDKEDYDKIGPALVGAIAEIPSIEKNAQAYGYKYATLDDILTVVRPILKKHGLAIIQPLDGDDLITMLMHKSGQHITHTASIASMSGSKQMNELQAIGAAITYMRRYALSSILCISTDEDTDGATGQKAQTKPTSEENKGSFKGFRSAATVKAEEHKSSQTDEELVAEIREIEDEEAKAEVSKDPPEKTLDEHEEAGKALEATMSEAIKEMFDWDEDARRKDNLCTKKQQNYIFSLAQRTWGAEFEMEDITGFTSVDEDEFIDMDPERFCGKLTKSNAVRVINDLKELAGVV